jgi:Holliday junction resolvase RusA-like endonuclease
MWVKPEAQEYLASKAAIALQFRSQMAGGEMIGRHPLGVEILFCRTGGFHHCDLDNLVKGVLDAANGIVYADDRWIDSIIANRIAHGGSEDKTIFKVWEE